MSKWRKSPPELIDQFKSTINNLPDAELRQMFGYPCSFVDDKMFTGLHQENWVLRLNDDDRQYMSDTYSADPFEPTPGRTMREYISIPQSNFR